MFLQEDLCYGNLEDAKCAPGTISRHSNLASCLEVVNGFVLRLGLFRLRYDD